MSAEAPQITTLGEIRCPEAACRFAQRHINMAFAARGYTSTSHRCENNRCKKWMTVLFEISQGVSLRARVVGVQPRLGRDEEAMRRTLRQFRELRGPAGEDHIEFMITTGKLLGWIATGGSRGAQSPSAT